MTIFENARYYFELVGGSAIKGKTFNSSQTVTSEDIEGNTLAQFPYEYGGYILAVEKKYIYIFSVDITFIGQDYSGPKLTGVHYSLVPYKKVDDELHYIIGFLEDKKIKLYHIKYNINTKESTDVENLSNIVGDGRL